MLFKRTFLSCIFVISIFSWSHAQEQQSTAVTTYDQVIDNPYAINRLWIHLQPVYGELFVTNVNIGFGIQVDYQVARGLELEAQWRRAYTKATDFARETAGKNQDNQDNSKAFNYLQFGGNIHIADRLVPGNSKIILYSKRYRGKKWANRMPETLVVPSQVRKVYGLRWGGFMFNTTTDFGRAAAEQGIILVDNDNNQVSDASLYTNVDVKAIYIGASLGLIKHIAIKPHRDFGVLVNDLNFNAYMDVLYAPSVDIEDLILGTSTISGDQLSTQEFGFRAGVAGKFNKKVGYAYGAEIGYRPSVRKRGFYTMFKISFPVFGIPPQDQPEAYR